MKKHLLALILFIFSNSLLLAQVPVWQYEWDKKAGGSEEDIIGTFQVTPDSGYILGGTSFSGVSGDKSQANYDTSLVTSDFWLVKTDAAGNIQWDKRYGGARNEILHETIGTADGGFISGGQSYSGSDGDKTDANWDTSLLSNDYWILKTDQNGLVQWDKRFGGTSYELFGSLRQVADGGYIITGSSFSGADGDKTEINQGGWDYWLVRTDASGNLVWEKRFGGTGEDFSNSITIASDGNYLIAGYSNSGQDGDKSEPGRGNYDYWILKVDDSGNKIWDKTFGGNYNDWFFALCNTADNGFVLGGQSHSEATGDKTNPNHDLNPSGSDRWVVKIDANGIKQWDKTIGGYETDDLSRITSAADGGFLLSGESYSDIGGDKTEANLGPEQTWVVKIDSSGIIQWDKTILTYGHDEGGSALPVGANCFVAVNFTQADTGGYKSEIGWGDGDYWMIKMCDASLLSNPETGNQLSGWHYFPNPVSNEIFLYSNKSHTDLIIQLFDASGKLIKEEHRTGIYENSAVKLDASQLKPGIYVCRIIDSKNVTNFRLLKTG